MSIIDRKRFGLVLRAFSKTPEQVAKNADQTVAAALAAAVFKFGDKPVFSNILILVAADPAYPDCDCGETKAAIEKLLAARSGLQRENIDVHEVAKGDLFCGILNYGVAKMLRDRIDYVGILSHGAKAYLTLDVLQQMVMAFEAGAKVTGVAIDELSQSILEGRIANTFALWDAIALMSVGGFDLRAAQPRKDDKTVPYLRGWNAEADAEVFYPQAGVEEIIPLLRLSAVHGPCIAPILPLDFEVWREPDPATDPEGYKRHLKKMGTKRERQTAHANAIGCDLSALKGGVMPAYRRF